MHDANPLPVKSGRVDPTSIASGSASDTTPSNPGVNILTIPAGKVFVGEVSVSVFGGTTAPTAGALLQISVDGAGSPTPADEAVLWEGRVPTAANTVTNFPPFKVTVAAGSASATLMLDGSGTFGTSPAAVASANGVFVDALTTKTS